MSARVRRGPYLGPFPSERAADGCETAVSTGRKRRIFRDLGLGGSFLARARTRALGHLLSPAKGGGVADRCGHGDKARRFVVLRRRTANPMALTGKKLGRNDNNAQFVLALPHD